jgi:hypothetical protein
MTFIARFLKHALLKGFAKVRYFGLYNPNCSQTKKNIAVLIEAAFGFQLPNDKPEPNSSRPFAAHTAKAARLGLAQK